MTLFLAQSASWPRSDVLNAILLGVTVLSVACAFLAYRHQRLRTKKEAACTLAQYYADTILREYSYISNAYRASGLDEKIRAWFPLGSIHAFSSSEFSNTLRRAQVDAKTVTRAIEQPELKTLHLARLLCRTDAQAYTEPIREYAELSRASDAEQQLATTLLQNEFAQDINRLLNHIEYFAMNLRYGIADEALLYQSLHQSYISMLWMLYYYICKVNLEATEDKFFTNAIWLFTTWRKRLEKMKKRRESAEQRSKRKTEQAGVYAGRAL